MKTIILKQKNNIVYLISDNEIITFFEDKSLSEVTKWIHNNLKNCLIAGECLYHE